MREHDVESRRRKFGENIVVHEERTNPMKLFVSAFINPFIGVLTALILISFVLDVVLAEPGEQNWTTIIIISTMVVFSVFLPFLPMLSIHLLIQNLLYDISQTAIPFDKMDKEFLLKPRRWDSSDIARFMIFIVICLDLIV